MRVCGEVRAKVQTVSPCTTIGTMLPVAIRSPGFFAALAMANTSMGLKLDVHADGWQSSVAQAGDSKRIAGIP
jgi:hypothetical protein